MAGLATSGLAGTSRGHWLVTSIRDAASVSRPEVTPVELDDEPSLARLFWWLYLCRGLSQSAIARVYRRYVDRPWDGDVLQRVKAVMWMGGKRPKRAAAPGLEALTAAIQVRLGRSSRPDADRGDIAFATTVAYEVQQLNGEAPVAVEFLHLLVFLAAHPIPLDYFKRGWRQLAPELRPVARDSLSELIDALVRRGLAEQPSDGTAMVPARMQTASGSTWTGRHNAPRFRPS